jgi:hypothetical protein
MVQLKIQEKHLNIVLDTKSYVVTNNSAFVSMNAILLTEILLTPQTRIFPEKLKATQTVKKLPTVCGT